MIENKKWKVAADSAAWAAIRARCHYVNKKWLGGMLMNREKVKTETCLLSCDLVHQVAMHVSYLYTLVYIILSVDFVKIFVLILYKYCNLWFLWIELLFTLTTRFWNCLIKVVDQVNLLECLEGMLIGCEDIWSYENY